MGFRDLNIAIRYRSSSNDFARDFYLPVLSNAIVYKRAVGYFSTSILLQLSTGLFALEKNGGKVYIVCSPYLSTEDLDAINKGYKEKEKVITEALIISLTNPLNDYEEERLNLIATMIAEGMLELKLAFMKSDKGYNLYHEKIAIMEDSEGDCISYAGSMNESENAICDNFESIYTFCSWKDNSQQEAVITANKDFDDLWSNKTKKIEIIDFPDVIIDRLKQYRKGPIRYDTDISEYAPELIIKKKNEFHVPDGLELREHQKEAIHNWVSNSFKGIYDMCTGAGKTIAALGSIANLSSRLDHHLATFIVCPFIHLVGQWEEDVVRWGGNPIIAHSSSTDKQWEKHLMDSYRRFRSIGKPFICITTNATFRGDKIQQIIRNITEDMNVLLIVDEAHNFGSQNLANVLPYNIKYRIGLSATIERYMDRTGTDKLFEYFGERCIVYDLQRAIKDKVLVPYEYHPVYVYLDKDELKKYEEITTQLKKYIVNKNGKIKISESGKLLVFQRTRVLAGARQKVSLLKQLMQDYKNKKLILVYCGATTTEDEDNSYEDRQIDVIDNMIERDLGMRVHKFTSEEDLELRTRLKDYFATGFYQVLTAIKCLDEGVNIPGIETAFILSSSRNPKEFVQRRGRLLRKSKGKERAVIFDFVTLPRPFNEIHAYDFENDKSILIGELARIYEFGRLSLNSVKANRMIEEIQEAYNITLNLEDELKKLEDEFSE